MKKRKIEKRIKDSQIARMQELHNEFEEKVNERIKELRSVLSSERLETRELKASEELFRSTFEHAAVGIAHVGLDGHWIRVNKRFCEIAGWSEKELLKQSFLETTHPDYHKLDLELIGKLMSGEVPVITMEKRYVRKDGSTRWVRVTGSVVRNELGNPKYGIGIVEDIHEKKEAEETMKLLAESGKLLAGSLDYNETLSTVADLMVPKLADWCVIDLLKENGEYECVRVAHANPEDKKLAEFLYNNASKRHDENCLSGKVVLSKKAILVPDVKESKGEAAKGCPYAKDPGNSAVSKIKPISVMVVPLIARRKVLGIMSLRSTNPARKYSERDLALVEQIASRAALAVDNARLYDQAQKAVEVRDDFLGIASHELKTSLTTVKALTQILQKESKIEKSEHRVGLLSKMDTQLNRTTKLINDLLDVSKINSGRITVQNELLDIYSVVEEVVENCRRFSEQHEIILEGDARETVYADKERINQVITNLITNAIKYSPDTESIIVRVSRDNKHVVISVQDFGIGIVEENRRKIFERFYRADTFAKYRVAGVGLGLYISQKLIEQLGGAIWVDSRVGKGSTFFVSLPVVKVEKTAEFAQPRPLKLSKPLTK